MGKRTGRPRGRPRGPWPGKPVRDAIRMALMRRMPDGRRRIDVLGELIVDLAMNGNAKMIRLVCDRIDGRCRTVQTGVDQQS